MAVLPPSYPFGLLQQGHPRKGRQERVYQVVQNTNGGRVEMKEEEIKKASRELVEAVEKYIQPKKGEFLSRIGLLVVLRKVKKIINEDK